MLEKSRQLNAYSLARKHAQGMAEDQRETFLQPHLAQGQQFLEARPSQSSLSHGSSSQATSATSLTAEASVPIVPPELLSDSASSAICEGTSEGKSGRLLCQLPILQQFRECVVCLAVLR
jgi:hypothetical protein